MKRRPTEELVERLVGDLSPVAPIARVSVAASAVVALSVAAVAATGWITGEWPRLDEAAFWSDAIAVAVLLGLAVAALGAIVGALASAVPGREPLARAGRIGAGLGVSWCIGWGLWAAAAVGPAARLLVGSANCLLHALVLAIPAALAICFYRARGAPQRRWLDAAFAAAGAAGLGALAVHASCSVAGGFHLLIGHCATPVVAALAFAWPLAALVRRWSPPAFET